MSDTKRKDNKGRVLRTGEQQRTDGRYMYTYIDPVTKEPAKPVYSWKLEPHDKIPKGKRPDISLREKERQIEKDLRDKISYQAGKLTVLELTERYIAQKRNVRPTTQAGYKTVLNYLKKDAMGKRRIDSIKTSDARLWLIKLQDEGKSFSSIHSIRGVVRPAFRMAVEDDLLRKNPFDFELADALINDSVKRYALTPKQERKFLEFVKEDNTYRKYHDGMFILFKTGLRISELCGLTVKDIDFKERTINIERQLQYTAGKKAYIEKTKTLAGKRVLPMSDEVYEAFQRGITKRKRPKVECMIDGCTGFLFLDERGTPMLAYQWEKKFQSSVGKYNSIYKEELPKITPHIARHTYCSNLVKRQVGVKTVQYLMGHADIQTTLNIYAHYRMEDARNDLERARILEEINMEMDKTRADEALEGLKRIRSL